MSKCKRHLTPHPADSWAQVELYRWQHGTLPGEHGQPEKPLSVPAALRAMAAAIRKKDPANFPSPFSVMTVLDYAAKVIADGKEAADA